MVTTVLCIMLNDWCLNKIWNDFNVLLVVWHTYVYMYQLHWLYSQSSGLLVHDVTWYNGECSSRALKYVSSACKQNVTSNARTLMSTASIWKYNMCIPVFVVIIINSQSFLLQMLVMCSVFSQDSLDRSY